MMILSKRNILTSFLIGLMAVFTAMFPVWATPHSQTPATSHLKYSPPVTVKKVLNGKSFVIEDDTIVRLALIQAPNIQENDGLMRPGEPMGQESYHFLKKLIEGKKVELCTRPPVIDRRGRHVALVKLASDGTLVQDAILKAGMGVTYPFAENTQFLPDLLTLDAEAHHTNRGIWQHPYWKPAIADRIEYYKERFQLVEGIVQKVASAGGNWYLNFGKDYKTDFTGYILKADYRKQFRNYDLKSLQGKHVILRGRVYNHDGVMMDIVVPEQIEVLSAK